MMTICVSTANAASEVGAQPGSRCASSSSWARAGRSLSARSVFSSRAAIEARMASSEKRLPQGRNSVKARSAIAA
jgi:hypothetical protein